MLLWWWWWWWWWRWRWRWWWVWPWSTISNGQYTNGAALFFTCGARRMASARVNGYKMVWWRWCKWKKNRVRKRQPGVWGWKKQNTTVIANVVPLPPCHRYHHHHHHHRHHRHCQVRHATLYLFFFKILPMTNKHFYPNEPKCYPFFFPLFLIIHRWWWLFIVQSRLSKINQGNLIITTEQ